MSEAVTPQNSNVFRASKISVAFLSLVQTFQTKPHYGEFSKRIKFVWENPKHIYKFWPVCRGKSFTTKDRLPPNGAITHPWINGWTTAINAYYASVLSTLDPGTLPGVKLVELPGTRVWLRKFGLKCSCERGDEVRNRVQNENHSCYGYCFINNAQAHGDSIIEVNREEWKSRKTKTYETCVPMVSAISNPDRSVNTIESINYIRSGSGKGKMPILNSKLICGDIDLYCRTPVNRMSVFKLA